MSVADVPVAKPVPLDVTKASSARVYDAFLEGKDSFALDRQIADRVTARVPGVRRLAREHRAWMLRVVRFLAKIGIDQFLDCGCGLPGEETVHAVAQRVNPDARVLYLDNDPVVAARARALLEDRHRIRFVEADLTVPGEVLRHPVVRSHFDGDRPIGVLHGATLHHVADRLRPEELMREYVDALAPGSYVALTHLHDPGYGSEAGRLAEQMAQIFTASALEPPAHFRDRARIERLFAGLDLIEPGLVPLREWWPDGPDPTPLEPVDELLLGGVARK